MAYFVIGISFLNKFDSYNRDSFNKIANFSGDEDRVQNL